jgi:DNA polymerase|tara:strand:- start:132 stop:734 length:603 start_codon:yes stop_codon:yes gene_type:complete
MSLEDIANNIRVCNLCSLSKSRTLVVPGEGPVDAELMFVGEGPGAKEDIQGRPFVGYSGKYLDTLLGLIGLKRQEVFIVNIVKCRPPENRVPSWDERKACLPYLKAQIKCINPNLICTLGNTALETLTGEKFISRVHGCLLKKENIQFFPMYHPAAALHNPALRYTLKSDMYELKNILDKVVSSLYSSETNNTTLDSFLL